MAETAIFLANAAKSNSAYLSINQAMADIKEGNYGQVPFHLRDHSFSRPDEKGQKYAPYQYPHDYPEEDFKIQQSYLPEDLKGKVYYHRKKIRSIILAKCFKVC